MIVMVNGAFGVGKSTTALQLVKQVPNAIIYDPEEVGLMLRNIIPKELKLKEERTGDFQDLELWRILVVQVAQQIVQKYRCNLIVPMTLKNKGYFDFVFEGLRNIDEHTFCFCLMASKGSIHARLAERGDEPESWAYHQTDDCIKAFSSDYFGENIDAENNNVSYIVDYIIGKLGIV
ncbi:MAG: tunicamycin resistance protein [Clostridiales bacterium GWB2_37_7]|nr:MAG: tunicamycin resistance protein [Clostridiales bacterium GWB2_37_7]